MWAAEAGGDLVRAESFRGVGEALLAMAPIRVAGLPAVVTFAVHREGTLRDEISPAAACRRAEQAGADVVGLNCIRGPLTMLPLLAPSARPCRARWRPCQCPIGPPLRSLRCSRC